MTTRPKSLEGLRGTIGVWTFAQEGMPAERSGDIAAELEEILLAHGADFFAEDEDAAGVGAEQAVGQLEEDALAYAGGTEEDAHLAGADLEGDVFKDRLLLKGDGDIVENHDGLSGNAGSRRR